MESVSGWFEIFGYLRCVSIMVGLRGSLCSCLRKSRGGLVVCHERSRARPQISGSTRVAKHGTKLWGLTNHAHQRQIYKGCSNVRAYHGKTVAMQRSVVCTHPGAQISGRDVPCRTPRQRKKNSEKNSALEHGCATFAAPFEKLVDSMSQNLFVVADEMRQ